MGNMCFTAKSQRRQRKFSKDFALRPCKFHSETSVCRELVKTKYTTLLIRAIRDSHFTCLLALIEAGADVNETTRYGEAPLHCHPFEHRLSYDKQPNEVHSRCIKLLVKKGADVNIRTQDGQLPLHKAAQANHVDCLELFVQLGADVHAKTDKGKTPFFAAAENGKYECIKKLIELGADVNIKDDENCPPVFFVAMKGFHECLKFLIQSGADVNCVSIKNFTSLMFAAWCDNKLSSKLCVKYLLRAGAHVNKINQFGQNALQISVATKTTFFFFQAECDDHYGKDVVILLLAAGETIEGTTVKRIHFNGYGNRTEDVPQYLQDFKKIQLSLKWACREAIRKKLIQLDPHTNLFIRVPKLRSPKILQSYLLYDMSVV